MCATGMTRNIGDRKQTPQSESSRLMLFPRLIHVCVMTHSYVCLCVQRLIHTCAMTHSYECHGTFIYAPSCIHMRAITHSLACHDAFMCAMAPYVCFLMCAMTHSYICYDAFICVLWLVHMCSMTHSLEYSCAYTRETTSEHASLMLNVPCATMSHHTATHCNTLQHTAAHCNIRDGCFLQCVTLIFNRQ